MLDEKKELDTLVQEKIDTDTDFQTSLEGLEEEEQNRLIADKKAEVIKTEFSSLQEKADKAEEVAKNQKIRAEKAEAAAKKPKGDDTPKNEEKPNYSLKDIRALSNVHDDDVERVEKFAKDEGITVAEAMKNSDLQAILRNRGEKRKTAEVAHTGGSRGGSSKTSDEKILDDFEKGILPETDEDIDRLTKAQMSQRKAKVKRD